MRPRGAFVPGVPLLLTSVRIATITRKKLTSNSRTLKRFYTIIFLRIRSRWMQATDIFIDDIVAFVVIIHRILEHPCRWSARS